MELRGTVVRVVSCLLLLWGCSGSNGPERRADGGDDDDDDNGLGTVAVCPNDPDGDRETECPGFFTCAVLADMYSDGAKRCVAPGPDRPPSLPGAGLDWACTYTTDGYIECSQEGQYTAGFEDNGGGSMFDCQQRGELVVCRRPQEDSDYPSPDEGGREIFYCYFQSDVAICDRGFGDGEGWMCFQTVGAGGAAGYRCRNTSPGVPSEGQSYVCRDVEEAGQVVTRCQATGPVPTDAAPGWTCVQEPAGDGTTIIHACTHAPELPPQPPTSEGPMTPPGTRWVCSYEPGADMARICDYTTSGFPPSGDDDDDDDDDDRIEHPPGSSCPAGAHAWCDDRTYCSWGIQICMADSRWSDCMEPVFSTNADDEQRLVDRPNTIDACHFYYFNTAGCEDQMDRDGDGHADCLFRVPGTAVAAEYQSLPLHEGPPDCDALDAANGYLPGTLCASCEYASDCGMTDICVTSSDPTDADDDGEADNYGYAFCSIDGTLGCPAGYRRTEGANPVCIPTTGRCPRL